MLIKTKYLFVLVTVLIIALCYALTAYFAGFREDNARALEILLCDFMVIIAIYVIGEPIQFLVLAIDRAIWPPKQPLVSLVKNVKVHERLDYLNLRLATLKNQLNETEEHRNEYLNSKFQLIAVDVWLYGKYFILLTCMVLVSRSELYYYNTSIKQEGFLNNHTSTFGISAIKNVDDIYYYIETQLIDAFTNPYDNRSNWYHAPQNKRIGAIRLRQLRRNLHENIGFDAQRFTHDEFTTKWKRPYVRQPYTNKYWSIFTPWLPAFQYVSYFNKAITPNWDGYFQSYPQLDGYVVLLSRYKNNSNQILNYLKEHDWIDSNTAVVFMEFTMFSPDSNIFSVCTLQVEQTPHGTIVGNANVKSVKFKLYDLLGVWGTICCCMYIIVLIQFSSTLVVTLWYEPRRIRKIWNQIDLIILILNVLVILTIIWIESMLTDLLNEVEMVHITKFLDFNAPIRVKDLNSILLGFLICVTTLRLWKVLQFAKVFQLMTNALYTALPAIASSSLILIIVLTAFSMVTVIINGNNSENLFAFFPGILSTVRNCFGYSETSAKKEYAYGGKFLCLVFYLIMAFIISQLLINVFISMLSNNFKDTKNNMDEKFRHKINFLEFLKVEYASWFRWLQILPCFSKCYNPKNRTVGQNIKRKLDNIERGRTRLKSLQLPKHEISDQSEASKHAAYIRRIERIMTISEILGTQMELLEVMLFPDKPEGSSDESNL